MGRDRPGKLEIATRNKSISGGRDGINGGTCSGHSQASDCPLPIWGFFGVFYKWQIPSWRLPSFETVTKPPSPTNPDSSSSSFFVWDSPATWTWTAVLAVLIAGGALAASQLQVATPGLGQSRLKP